MHIDWWTLAIQAVNVLILVWLLARFFWRPLLKIIEERRVAAAKQLSAAQAAQAAADGQQAEIAAARAGIAAERDKLLAEARAQIAAERDVAGKDAAAAAARQRADGAAGIARDREAMETSLADKAADLAVAIARRLLARRPVEEAPDLMLAARLKSLSQHSRDLLAGAAGRKDGITIATAHPFDVPAQDEIREQLEQVLGVRAHPAFVTDPSLIAGFRLQSDALILNDNWGNDLAQILKDLKNHDGRQQVS